MKTTKENILDKPLQQKRHPVRQKFLSVLLCVCLLLVSLPVEFYGGEVQAEESRQRILSFSDLPEEVKQQTVEVGTSLEELDLPDTLTAICVPVENESTINMENLDQPEINSVIKGTDLEEGVSLTEQQEPSGHSEEEALEENNQEELGYPSEGLLESPVDDSEIGTEESPETAPEVETDIETNFEEAVIIENIIWISIPTYDSEIEGVSVFMPVLPEKYVLAEGVELPEIHVTVRNDEILEEDGKRRELDSEGKRKKSDVTEKIKEEYDGAESIGYFVLSSRSSEVISTDTIWDENKILSGGELVINEGVTLTINSTLTIDGNVTIRGGGTIERGSSSARIAVDGNGSLAMQNITLDGKGFSSSYSMIDVNAGTLILDDDSRIQNCNSKDSGGAVYLSNGAAATFNDCMIENCSAHNHGGAVFSEHSNVTINKGIYRNNKTTLAQSEGGSGGGFIMNKTSILHIYGGHFIENTTIGMGGAIYHTGNEGTKTYLYGGFFQGNTSKWKKYAGSGAVWVSSVATGKTDFDISSNVKFCGDGTDSGMDGVYLDSQKSTPRKIKISNTLSYPVTLYVKAIEGYVIAEGVNQYRLLHKRDMKNIKFVDVGDSGEKWYAVLDSDSNQVKISKIDPRYQYFVYYISNGAEGTVADDREYEMGDTATVKPADELSLVDADFVEWNTEPDGNGTAYQPGDELEIQGDVRLYAIFQEKDKKQLKANFYSGSLCEKKVKSTVVNEDAGSGEVTAPALEEMEGWEPVGWEKEDSSGYGGKVEAEKKVILEKAETDYYGIYRKNVILSYEAEGVGGVPESEEDTCYANVHGEITYQEAEFTVVSGLSKNGFDFIGWNTKANGQGNFYQPGSGLKITEDTVLFAVFQEKGKKTFVADFYSGGSGQKESIQKTVGESITDVSIVAPALQDFPGWEPVGWSRSKTGFESSIAEHEECTLTEFLTEYYGIYQKNVVLSYDSNGGGTAPESEEKPCHVNVHEEITYDVPEFTIAAEPSRQGYAFQGWNTQADGGGEMLQPGTSQILDTDTLLYAVWEEMTAAYQVEYYCQDLIGDGYTKMDADTKHLTGRTRMEAEAPQIDYIGFNVNLSHPSGKPKGTIEQDGSLVLKLYYDRNIYEVDFNLNGGSGDTPDTQKIRYGGLLEKVPEPTRRGYNFKGWNVDSSGLDGGLWDFESPVENNTGTLHTTLCAKWADEWAPAMGEASFGTGHRNFLDWLIQKESMVITVPVMEEGSGLAKAEYLLVAEDGTEKDGTAQISEIHPGADTMATYGSGAFVIRGLQAQADQGSYEARISIEEEFKGKVYLTCIDYAGNVSPQKILTAAGGGIIVEDNAPEICFSNTKETTGGKPLKIKVQVKDNGKDHVTGGISGIRYQVDKEKKTVLSEEDFAQVFVENYEFTVKISGEGKHTLKVKAEDHAGNESTAQITLKINGRRDVPAEIPGNPKRSGYPTGGEPKTGDSTHVQIYATIAMIAGFGYLLLYFEGENGITEQEKEEIVYRLVTWAKQGGRIRRWLGIAVIFLFLAYYHSIGKSVDVEWKSMRITKR